MLPLRPSQAQCMQQGFHLHTTPTLIAAACNVICITTTMVMRVQCPASRHEHVQQQRCHEQPCHEHNPDESRHNQLKEVRTLSAHGKPSTWRTMCMCKQTAAVSCASILSKHTQCTCSRLSLSRGQLQGGDPDAPPVLVSHTNMQQVCLCYCQSCVTPFSRQHQNRPVQKRAHQTTWFHNTHTALVAAWCTHGQPAQNTVKASPTQTRQKTLPEDSTANTDHARCDPSLHISQTAEHAGCNPSLHVSQTAQAAIAILSHHQPQATKLFILCVQSTVQHDCSPVVQPIKLPAQAGQLSPTLSSSYLSQPPLVPSLSRHSSPHHPTLSHTFNCTG